MNTQTIVIYMISALPYFVNINLLEKAHIELPAIDSKLVINSPTNNFFYDPWKIKPEYKGTVWEELINSIPIALGEARIIFLKHMECYSNHCDIDDRCHLTISAKHAFLISLDTETMYRCKVDGIWYEMDASHMHTATNFGNQPRIQLVVRKLLNRSTRNDLKSISITTKLNLESARYHFDDKISSFLNKVNKNNGLNNFVHQHDSIDLDIAPEYINELKTIAGNNFTLTINE